MWRLLCVAVLCMLLTENAGIFYTSISVFNASEIQVALVKINVA